MPSSCLIFRTSQIDSNRTLINYGETPILVLVKGTENTGEQIKYYGGLEFTAWLAVMSVGLPELSVGSMKVLLAD